MTEIKIATVKDIKDGGAKVISVSGKTLALFNINGEFFAVDNACLHKGGPLGEGAVEGSVVTCPLHGWKYDVTSGQCVFPAAHLKLNSYKVRIKGEDIFIEI